MSQSSPSSVAPAVATKAAEASSSNSNDKKYNYGWVPDIPDKRDRYFRDERPLSDEEKKKLPKKVDLRQNTKFEIYDQGKLGSCTSNSVAADIRHCTLKQSKKDYTASRLFMYYNTRKDMGTINSDSGTSIRDMIKSVNRLGACLEKSWPYEIKKYTQAPPKEAYTEAEKHQALLYERVYKLDNMKAVLASGLPFLFGFTVYESFQSEEVEKTGIVTMPDTKKEKVVGSHAVLAVGYNDDDKRFIVRNSWGESWGDKGFFYMPYDYLTDRDLSDDFWTITLMEEGETVEQASERLLDLVSV